MPHLSPRRNTRCRSTATPWLALAAAAVFSVAAPHAPAQPPSPPAPTGGLTAAAMANAPEPPAPTDALRIHRLVREHFLAADGAPLPALPPVHGCSITLRLAGRVIGRSEVLSDTGPFPQALAAALSDAAAQADTALSASGGMDAAASRGVMRAAVMIDVELAGPPVPIDPAPETYAQLAEALAPGLEGLLIRLRSDEAQVSVALFPSDAVATGITSAAAAPHTLARLAGDLRLALAEPADLVREHNATFHRFRVTHLVQPAPGAEPVFTHRGARAVDLSTMTAAELRSAADRTAGFLLRELSADADRPLRDDALALFALDRYAALRHIRPGARAALGDDVREIHRLRTPTEPPADPIDAAAAILGGLTTVPPPALSDVFSPEAGFSAAVPPAAKGFIALALVRVAAQSDADTRSIAVARAAAAVRRTFADTHAGALVSQMPWLGYAELELARLSAEPDAPPDIPSTVALRRMRDSVWTHQLSAADLGPDGVDLLGGIVFTRGGPPLPTWHTARPLAFLAAMLPEPSLTDAGERPAEIARLIAGARFLRQLQADEFSNWTTGGRPDALGAIHAAPWDRRPSFEASAMTLLALTELLAGLDRLAAPPPEQPGAQP